MAKDEEESKRQIKGDDTNVETKKEDSKVESYEDQSSGSVRYVGYV